MPLTAPGSDGPDTAAGPDLTAAGAVVFRKRSGGEVLLVHRPKYDDWSWPKGKQDPGEHVTSTAVREVLEETGVEIRLTRPLASQTYIVSGGRMKTVHYWVGRVLGNKDVATFVPNAEIDDLGWFTLEKARKRLTYTDDVDLLDHLEADQRRTSTLIVLRHARAIKRATWKGADEDRALTNVGREQARRLIPVLSAYGISRVVSSDSRRCLRTVRPYVRDQVLTLEADPGLNETDSSPQSVKAIVQGLLSGTENAVICSHRPVLPQIFAELGIVEEPLSPGEMVVVHHRKGRVVATERYLVR